MSTPSLPNKASSTLGSKIHLGSFKLTKPQIKEFFLAPPETRNIERLVRMLNRLILMRVAVLSVLLSSNAWTLLREGSLAHTKLLFWCFGGIYAVSLANAWALRALNRPRRIGYVQLTVDVFLATLAAYVVSPVVTISLYLALIVGAALVFSRHGAVIIAAIAGISYGVLAAGLLPSLRFAASAQEILGVYVALVSIALVSGYLAKQLEIVNTLADSRGRAVDDLSKKQSQLLNDITDGIVTIDLNATITGINEAARAIVGLAGLSPEHFVGKPFRSAFREYGIEGVEQLAESIKAADAAGETTLKGAHIGKDVHLHYSVRALSDSQGNTTGKMLIFSDISHVKSIQDRLELHERMMKLLAAEQEQPAQKRLAGSDLEMVGESHVMQRVFTLVQRVASSDASVLITGESGTGKELIARAIHANGDRSGKPFVAINCGAIPENLIESELFGHKKGAFTGAVSENPGLFRQAQDGTIFLDEVGELPLHLQTKLLRVLQERTVRAVGDIHDHTVDVRVIAATNRDLKKEITQGRFREDLYYRLNVVNIMVPPLRERRDDIPLMVKHFITHRSDPARPVPQISPDALQLLVNYPFPGNVRELENVIERALVLGGSVILPDHLPEELLQNARKPQLNGYAENGHGGSETEITILPIDLEAELEKLERRYLNQALAQSGGVKKHAAELLGLNFRSFRYRLKKYGMAEGISDLGDEG